MNACCTACCGVPESLARTVKLEAPAVVGVPAIAPEPFMDNPAGKVPLLTLQVMVPTPPLDCRLALYAVLTTPLGRAVVVMASLGLIVMLSDWFTVCGGVPESVAVAVKLVAPAAVGVPEISPAPLKFNPPGKLPLVTLQLIVPVPPEAASAAL